MDDATQSSQITIRPLPTGKPAIVQSRTDVNGRRPARTPNGLVHKQGLTRMQQLFVEFYLQAGCRGAAEAARKAGYSEETSKVAYTVLLDNPKVMAEINRRMGKTFKNLEVTTDRIIEEVAKMAFSNILDFISIEENGSFKVDLTKVTRFNAAAINSLEFDNEGRPRIRLAEKQRALELLARMKRFNMLASPVDEKNGISGEKQPVTIERLDKIIQNFTTINQQFNGIPQAGQQLPAAPVIEGQL